MRIKLLSLLTILSVSFISFSQRQEMKKNGYKVTVDDMTGKVKKRVNLATSDFDTMSESSFGITKESGDYIIYSFLYKKDWLFVERILIKVDGKLFELNSIDNRREIEPQAYISERNTYIPTPELIEALKTAKEIKYRLYGKDYYMDYEINPKKMQPLADFFFE